MKTTPKARRTRWYRLTINDWLSDKKKVPLKGISIKNAQYSSDLDIAAKTLSRTAVVSNFCLTKMARNDYERSNYGTILRSAQKQREFCRMVQYRLTQYEVDPRYDKAFERDIKQATSRSDYIYKIIQENLRLSKYWPFFNEHGFDVLLDFSTHKAGEGQPCDLDLFLLPEIEAWNKEHASEIEAHMEEIRPELERKERFIAKRNEAEKAEKDAKRAAKQKERELQKALKAKEEQRLRDKKREDREFDRLQRRIGPDSLKR